jgi:integration host factor subunit alpha
MTKVDLVDSVYEKLGSCTKEQAFDLVELTLETLKESIGKEGKVKIAGFGRFVVREKAARKGRNPITGEPLIITPRKVLTFIASPVLKNKVNDGGSL